MRLQESDSKADMNSCLGMLLAILVFTVVVGGGGLIWYLSHTAEFSRTDAAAPAARAIPVPGKR